VNIGWHHEEIVPDILEINQNVRDFCGQEFKKLPTADLVGVRW